jgi:hypothetical protein
MIHPPRPKVKGMLKIGALLVVLAFILFIWVNTGPVPIRVQVTFTGFANPHKSAGPTPVQFDFIPTTNPIAYFCVSNAGSCSVIAEGAYSSEITNKLVEVLFFNRLLDLRELKPGGSMTVPLPTPRGNKEPWRIALSFSKIDWRYRLAEKPSVVPGVIRAFALRKWLEHRLRSEFYSDWVNGPELLPATNTVKTLPE